MTSFEDIDARRASAGLTREAVCRRAGVNSETWRRTAKGRTQPNLRTLIKLDDAVTALEREKQEAGN
ncbi:MAG: helix-turn-helix transcriptional regulator [Bauldia sp.]|nr:helix-turn-helix transcriptional regulator [Bauldia sp.]